MAKGESRRVVLGVARLAPFYDVLDGCAVTTPVAESDACLRIS